MMLLIFLLKNVEKLLAGLGQQEVSSIRKSTFFFNRANLKENHLQERLKINLMKLLSNVEKQELRDYK